MFWVIKKYMYDQPYLEPLHCYLKLVFFVTVGATPVLLGNETWQKWKWERRRSESVDCLSRSQYGSGCWQCIIITLGMGGKTPAGMVSAPLVCFCVNSAWVNAKLACTTYTVFNFSTIQWIESPTHSHCNYHMARGMAPWPCKICMLHFPAIGAGNKGALDNQIQQGKKTSPIL